jgi:hypothetical protein
VTEIPDVSENSGFARRLNAIKEYQGKILNQSKGDDIWKNVQ